MFPTLNSTIAVTREYTLDLQEDVLKMFISDRRLQSIGFKTSCKIELTNRILNRKINSFKTAKYCIVRITGPAESSVQQCTRMIESIFPIFSQRKKYLKRSSTSASQISEMERAESHTRLHLSSMRSTTVASQDSFPLDEIESTMSPGKIKHPSCADDGCLNGGLHQICHYNEFEKSKLAASSTEDLSACSYGGYKVIHPYLGLYSVGSGNTNLTESRNQPVTSGEYLPGYVTCTVAKYREITTSTTIKSSNDNGYNNTIYATKDTPLQAEYPHGLNNDNITAYGDYIIDPKSDLEKTKSMPLYIPTDTPSYKFECDLNPQLQIKAPQSPQSHFTLNNDWADKSVFDLDDQLAVNSGRKNDNDSNDDKNFIPTDFDVTTNSSNVYIQQNDNSDNANNDINTNCPLQANNDNISDGDNKNINSEYLVSVEGGPNVYPAGGTRIQTVASVINGSPSKDNNNISQAYGDNNEIRVDISNTSSKGSAIQVLSNSNTSTVKQPPPPPRSQTQLISRNDSSKASLPPTAPSDEKNGNDTIVDQGSRSSERHKSSSSSRGRSRSKSKRVDDIIEKVENILKSEQKYSRDSFRHNSSNRESSKSDLPPIGNDIDKEITKRTNSSERSSFNKNDNRRSSNLLEEPPSLSYQPERQSKTEDSSNSRNVRSSRETRKDQIVNSEASAESLSAIEKKRHKRKKTASSTEKEPSSIAEKNKSPQLSVSMKESRRKSRDRSSRERVRPVDIDKVNSTVSNITSNKVIDQLSLPSTSSYVAIQETGKPIKEELNVPFVNTCLIETSQNPLLPKRSQLMDNHLEDIQVTQRDSPVLYLYPGRKESSGKTVKVNDGGSELIVDAMEENHESPILECSRQEIETIQHSIPLALPQTTSSSFKKEETSNSPKKPEHLPRSMQSSQECQQQPILITNSVNSVVALIDKPSTTVTSMMQNCGVVEGSTGGPERKPCSPSATEVNVDIASSYSEFTECVCDGSVVTAEDQNDRGKNPFSREEFIIPYHMDAVNEDLEFKKRDFEEVIDPETIQKGKAVISESRQVSIQQAEYEMRPFNLFNTCTSLFSTKPSPNFEIETIERVICYDQTGTTTTTARPYMDFMSHGISVDTPNDELMADSDSEEKQEFIQLGLPDMFETSTMEGYLARRRKNSSPQQIQQEHCYTTTTATTITAMGKQWTRTSPTIQLTRGDSRIQGGSESKETEAIVEMDYGDISSVRHNLVCAQVDFDLPLEAVVQRSCQSLDKQMYAIEDPMPSNGAAKFGELDEEDFGDDVAEEASNFLVPAVDTTGDPFLESEFVTRTTTAAVLAASTAENHNNIDQEDCFPGSHNYLPANFTYENVVPYDAVKPHRFWCFQKRSKPKKL